MKKYKKLSAVVLLSSLAGCYTTVYPEITPEIRARLPQAPASSKEHDVNRQARSASMRLDRVQVDLPVGTEHGYTVAYPPVCDRTRTNSIVNTKGRFTDPSPEWKDAFFKILTAHGYRVAGTPDRLFREQKAEEAELLVGANITFAHFRADIHTWGYCTPLSLTGSAKMTIEWQVFDPVARKLLLRRTVEGVYKTEAPIPPTYSTLLVMAYADAANNFALDPELGKVVSQYSSSAAQTAADETVSAALTRVPLLRDGFDKHTDRLRAATVLIEVGESSHGSGFIVSDDGLVLTNQHVVEGQRQVRVHHLDGRMQTGIVLRSDARRDVALVKLPDGVYSTIPVRETPVRVGEEVYAIGAPQMTALAWTVTRGVVSAYRKAMLPDRLDLIQADVAIHGGNSGGPLLDRHGNAVGIAVLGWASDRTLRNTGLNGFIPILDGLKHLELELVGPAGGGQVVKAE